MTPAPKLVAPAPAKPPYKPVLSANERRAYSAAYRILRLVHDGEVQLACPGARRSAMTDRVAQIVMDEFSR